ncbi:MAG TPA: PAS domain-containing protein [Stellaceae bacterium]|nr:PAS domain-containing protein [Stellaceae bacterium]
MSEASDAQGDGGSDAPGFKVGTTPDLVSSDLVRKFHDFWLSRRGTKVLPTKAEMDPVDMAQFLPNIVLTEVIPKPLDFRYRIIGEEIVSRLGNMTGKRVREMALNNLSGSAYQNYCFVTASRQPQFLEGEAVTAFKPDRPYLMSRVHCPLSTNGTDVDFIISCITLHRR